MFPESVTFRGKHFIRTFIPLQMLNRNSGRIVFVFSSVLNLSSTIGQDFFITILSNGLAYINIHFSISKKIFKNMSVALNTPFSTRRKSYGQLRMQAPGSQ